MVKKFLYSLLSALPLFGAVAGISLLYAVIHVMVSPLMKPVDASIFSAVRAPVVEEAFKYFILWKIFDSNSKKINLLKIGFGMGLAETTINLIVVYKDMMIDLKSLFVDFTIFELYLIISITLIFKFIFAGVLHAFFVFAGIKLSGERMLPAFFISVFIHWAANVFILT